MERPKWWEVVESDRLDLKLTVRNVDSGKEVTFGYGRARYPYLLEEGETIIQRQGMELADSIKYRDRQMMRYVYKYFEFNPYIADKQKAYKEAAMWTEEADKGEG